MSDCIIKDGVGNGYRVKVGLNHRLWCYSLVGSEFHGASEENGTAFSFAVNELSLSSTSSEYSCLQFTNTDNDFLFKINKVLVSWNGGSTSFNRPVAVRVRYGGDAPTANSTFVQPFNLNKNMSRTALSNTYVWNGVGSGMTIAQQGDLLYSLYVSQGLTPVDFESSFILAYGHTMTFTAQPAEAGVFSFILLGHYSVVD
jgi:hypothetical protein